MRKLSEGAEARVYLAKMFGSNVVVKVRHAKAYRIMELDENLRRTRTRREAKAMVRASEAGVRVPELFALGEFSIYMEKVTGSLLKDARQRGRYGGIGRMLAKMHGANVIHGDFTPANIMITPSGPCVIDFGLSEISESTEGKAIDLLLMKRSIGDRDYRTLAEAYGSGYAGSKQIFSRLADIEKRGRYQIRTLM